MIKFDVSGTSIYDKNRVGEIEEGEGGWGEGVIGMWLDDLGCPRSEGTKGWRLDYFRW